MSTHGVDDALPVLVTPGTQAATGPRTLPLGDAIVRLGVILAIAAVAGQTLAHIADDVLFDSRWDILNADREQNIPTWASAASAFAAAVGAVLGAVVPGRSRWVYGGLATILAYFSLDDAVGLHELIVHERVDELGTIEHAARVVWPVLYLPLLVGGLALLVLVARQAIRSARLAILAGLGMLVAAVAIEVLGTLTLELGLSEASFGYTLQVVIEEGLELGGWIVIATGLIGDAMARATETRAAETRRPD